MPRRHCKTCRSPLHADDTHTECVSCLGKSHADAVLSRADCSLRELQSCFSELNDSFLFKKPRDLWGKNSRAEDLSSRWLASSRRLNARTSRCHRESNRLSSSPNSISVPPRLRATWYRSLGVTMNWTLTAFLWRLQMRKSYRAPWLTPPSCRHLLHAAPDWKRTMSSSALCQRLSTSSGSNGLRLRNHLAAGWTSGFSRGAIRISANARSLSSPKCTTSSQNLGAHPIHLASAPLLQPLSHPLTWLCAPPKPQPKRLDALCQPHCVGAPQICADSADSQTNANHPRAPTSGRAAR